MAAGALVTDRRRVEVAAAVRAGVTELAALVLVGATELVALGRVVARELGASIALVLEHADLYLRPKPPFQ